MKAREIKFKVLLGTDKTLKTDLTFIHDSVFKPGEEFVMREVLPGEDQLVDRLVLGLKLLQNLEIDYAKDKENWKYAIQQMKMLRDDKYVGSQTMKHVDITAGEVLDNVIKMLEKPE